MMGMRWSLVAVLVLPCSVALAQGGIVQQQHDEYVRAQERSASAAAAHNNADDYPSNKPLPARVNTGPNYVPVLDAPYKRKYLPNIETEADHFFIGARQHYMSGEGRDLAMYQLAQCYYGGIGTAVDKPKAFGFWHDLGSKNPEALFLASVMQYDGDGIPKSEGWGFEGILHAARARNADAITWLAAHGFRPVLDPASYGAKDAELAQASTLVFGSGSERNVAAGLKLVREYAEIGYPWAHYYLGRMYEEGVGVPVDNDAAYWAYYAAADAVSAVVPGSVGKPSGSVEAAKRLGLAYWGGDLLGRKVSDTFALQYLAAPLMVGDAKVNFLYGEASEKGTHGFSYDMMLATKYYTVAAEQGRGLFETSAAARLARMYADGEGMPQDFTKSVQWARKAADDGETLGMMLLAYEYRAGTGVGKDAAKSVEWMKAAADKGDARAKEELTKGFDGMLKPGQRGYPVSSAERALKNDVVALPGILERAPGVFTREYAGNEKYTTAQIAGMEKMAADYEKAYAIKDQAKSMKAIAAIDRKKIEALGMAYLHGDGVAVNYVRGTTLLIRAGRMGLEEARVYAAWGILLGLIADKGDPRTSSNVGNAIGSFRVVAMGAQETPTPMSNYLMAIGTVWNENPPVMREYLVKAAEGGVTDAQIELAYMMWAGKGGPVDRAGALRFMQMAAKTDPNGMYALGAVMANGLNGVPMDKAKAKELLTAAAGMGQGQAVKMVASLQ